MDMKSSANHSLRKRKNDNKESADSHDVTTEEPATRTGWEDGHSHGVHYHPQVTKLITKTLWLKQRSKWTRLDRWPFVFLYVALICMAYYFAVVDPSEEALEQARLEQENLDTWTDTTSPGNNNTDPNDEDIDDLFDSTGEEQPTASAAIETDENSSHPEAEEIKPNMLVQMAPYDLRGAICYFLIPVVACVQALCWLLQEWSVGYHAFFAYKKVRQSPEEAEYIAMFPQKNKGKPEIVPIVPLTAYVDEVKELDDEVAGKVENHPCRLFIVDFQHTRYIIEYNPKTASTKIRPLSFPLGKRALWYKNFPGLAETTVNRLTKIYGDDSNDLKLPLPTFKELFKEHALAPFFVFQMFCVLLWCLDEYWYYSLFTLFMLMFLEATQVLQRLQQHSSLRQMRPHPAPVKALRSGSWVKLDSSKLLPGDVIQLSTKSKSQRNAEKSKQKVENPLMKYKREVEEFKQAKQNNPNTDMKPPTFPLGEMFNYFTGKNAKVVEDDSVCPADVLLLEGQAVVNEAMLTGESIPHVKEAITNDNQDCSEDDEKSWFTNHSANLVYGGTNIISCSGASSETSEDEHAKAIVLRTGYYTSQGDLMRTILFSSERVTVDNTEAYFFLLLLLVFAIVASSYVLYQGIQDESRSRFKLTLHCIMILTSVVPPELPLELSMAVSTSLGALTRQGIFCTEPFRIPMSGKIDTCCFDKTGTLTTEKVTIKGLVTNLMGNKSSKDKNTKCIAGIPICEPHLAKTNVTIALAGCNNVSSINKRTSKKDSTKVDNSCDMVGDPLEIAVLESMGWRPSGHNTIKDCNSAKSINVLHRYPFSAALKRMCTVVRPADTNKSYVCVKGAPEIVSRLLFEIPENYHETALKLTASGCRVLSLAYKELDSSKSGNNASFKEMLDCREELEKDLHFLAFLVVDCPLKPSSAKVIQNLKESSHRVVMITGDNAFTAAAVAHKCSISGHRYSNIINYEKEKSSLVTQQLDHNDNSTPEEKPFRAEDLDADKENCSFTVTGDALEYLQTTNQVEILDKLYENAVVFARVSPTQKEQIITSMNKKHAATLMCGDGTNDVGALKQSTVGISIISDPDLENVSERLDSTREERIQQRTSGGSAQQNQHLDKQIQELQKEMSMQSQVAQFGDASIAAPFTSKKPSVDVVPEIIREGRRTLVTTHQMFRILAVNSLLASYQLSALSLYGVKSGDYQATVNGMSQALFFMFVSFGKPYHGLTKERPHSTVFNRQLLVSIFGQFFIHLSSMILTVYTFSGYMDPNMTLDKQFTPNIINSVIFLLTLSMQATTFAVNYHGEPFMEPLKDNTKLWRGLLFVFGLVYVVTLDLYPDFNDMLQVIPIPEGGPRNGFLVILLVDTSLSFGVDRLSRYLL